MAMSMPRYWPKVRKPPRNPGHNERSNCKPTSVDRAKAAAPNPRPPDDVLELFSSVNVLPRCWLRFAYRDDVEIHLIDKA